MTLTTTILRLSAPGRRFNSVWFTPSWQYYVNGRFVVVPWMRKPLYTIFNLLLLIVLLRIIITRKIWATRAFYPSHGGTRDRSNIGENNVQIRFDIRKLCIYLYYNTKAPNNYYIWFIMRKLLNSSNLYACFFLL